MKRWKLWGLLVGLLLAAVGARFAYAAAVEENYKPAINKSSPSSVIVAHRATISGDDSATTVAPIDAQETRGNPTVVVAPRFSASGATVLVEVWLYQRTGTSTNTLMTVSARQTATASTTLRDGAAGAYLVHAPLVFDSYGADVYDVRYRTISSGTVESFAWSVGANSAIAE